MKKNILISTIICIIIAACASFLLCTQPKNLKSIEYNGKYGFINDKGKIVIDTQFDDIKEFQEGLAAVSLYGKWGFINKKGKFVIQPQYSKVGDFSEGRAFVVHEVEKKDDDGNIQVHDYVTYINKKGGIVVPTYDGGPYFYNYSSGLVAIQDGDATYCSYKNRNGKTILDSDYFKKTGWKNTTDAFCHDFSENILRVYKYTDDTYKTRISAFMNKKGEIVYSKKFDVPEDEEEGFCDFSSFNDGMASFVVNWKYGFINKNFEEVIPPIYDFAYEFRNNIAKVEKDGKWFYIDKQGNFVKEYKPNY